MTKQEFSKLTGLTLAQLNGERIEGSIYLRSLETIPEGVTLTAGGSIFLESLKTLPDGVTLTAGGNIYLRSLETLPEGVTLTAGGNIYLKNKTLPPNIPKHPSTWSGKYILADGILTEVISKRGNDYKVKIVGQTTESYLTTNGDKCAHGKTLKKAKEDLHFKIIAEKLKKEPIKKDTKITVQYYRILTGACESGCAAWMTANGVKDEPIKAEKLLPILEKTNAYGLDAFKKLVTF